MGPANIVFDRLQLHSWCIPKPWTNLLPLQLVYALLGLSVWDYKLQDVHSSFEWTKLCVNDEHPSSLTHTFFQLLLSRMHRDGEMQTFGENEHLRRCDVHYFPTKALFTSWDLKTFIDHIVNYTNTRYSRNSSLVSFSWASLHAFSW